MNRRRNQKLSLAVCVLLLLVTFFSLFYLAMEENHSCTGEDCPICACIHETQQRLKNLGTGVISSPAFVQSAFLSMWTAIGFSLFLFRPSLVSQKVRMND